MKSLASSSTKSIDLFDGTRWTSETSPEHREPEVAFVHDLPVQHLLRRCRDVGHGMRLPPYKMHESTQSTPDLCVPLLNDFRDRGALNVNVAGGNEQATALDNGSCHLGGAVRPAGYRAKRITLRSDMITQAVGSIGSIPMLKQVSE